MIGFVLDDLRRHLNRKRDSAFKRFQKIIDESQLVLCTDMSGRKLLFSTLPQIKKRFFNKQNPITYKI